MADPRPTLPASSRQVRDALAEALYRGWTTQQGGKAPNEWHLVDASSKAAWRDEADHFLAVLPSVGLRIETSEGQS